LRYDLDSGCYFLLQGDAVVKILIATPSYEGSVRKEYMQSIMRPTDYYRQAGIAWEMILESSTMLHEVR
jgi:hypothetical protein